jgi:hypothetical protein
MKKRKIPACVLHGRYFGLSSLNLALSFYPRPTVTTLQAEIAAVAAALIVEGLSTARQPRGQAICSAAAPNCPITTRSRMR